MEIAGSGRGDNAHKRERKLWVDDEFALNMNRQRLEIPRQAPPADPHTGIRLANVKLGLRRKNEVKGHTGRVLSV